ncbi:hypothetical protein DB347_11340 [Opitutaceae bacterium EW11]|nr:hypothetical protein DB347_11340 [Opitutaceae bacterium EW11]
MPTYTRLEGLVTDEELERYLSRDSFSIPVTADREGYHGERHFDWWLSGLRDYLLVKNAFCAHAAHGSIGRAFELGCASGRVLRHFACQNPECESWGADLNLRHVEWVRKFLPRQVKVFHSSILPSLPFPDAYLDVVYAFSVFTHIDYFEAAWLAELRRVLRPGGIAYLTVHTDATWSRMRAGMPVYDSLVRLAESIPDYQVGPDLFAGPMPKEKVVFSWPSALNYNCTVFHSVEYLNSYWARFLDIVEVRDQGHDYQDVVVLRRP